jgi:hypothetical protein
MDVTDVIDITDITVLSFRTDHLMLDPDLEPEIVSDLLPQHCMYEFILVHIYTYMNWTIHIDINRSNIDM